MTKEEIIQAKKEKRSIYREKRKDISKEQKEALDKILFDKIISLKEFCESSIVLVYYPINDEINTIPIIEYALSNGKRVALPISSTVDHTLTFRFISSLKELKCGAYSIPEPSEDSEMFNDGNNTLCIVPGLIFDRLGHRLGYGKGFYDRFLSGFNGITVGLCYSGFLLDRLPTDENDRAVDIILSDTEEVYL